VECVEKAFSFLDPPLRYFPAPLAVPDQEYPPIGVFHQATDHDYVFWMFHGDRGCQHDTIV